jgi:CRISPR-associated protein Csd1
MGWIEELCKTYDRCSSLAGKKDDAGKILLPVGQTVNNTDITIVINEQGDFIRAQKNGKNEKPTVMPILATRSGKNPPPRPLCDSLEYIAGDCNVLDASDQDLARKHNEYMKQLHEWSDRPDAPISLKAIYCYLEKGRVIDDLKICQLGKLTKKNGVRFVVRYKQPGHIENTWEDPELYDSFQKFLKTKYTQRGLDYISGENTIITKANKLPDKIRTQGDQAKLISSNDTKGFTYLGRFSTAEEAVGVGYLSVQKAFNTLRWLIQKQGKWNLSEVIVAWAPDDRKAEGIPSPTDELFIDQGIDDNSKEKPDTAEGYARKLNLAIAGYHAKIDDAEKIVVMAVDNPRGMKKGGKEIETAC